MHNRAFTLIELLITMTIIVLMALVAIPGFGKSQRLIELQSKGDEIKTGLEEIHIKAMNPEKGIERYYVKIDETNKTVEFGKIDTTSTASVYKTLSLTGDQTLNNEFDAADVYLVADKGKSFACVKVLGTYLNEVCPKPIEPTTMIDNEDWFSIENSDKITTFKIFANPFRVTSTTTP